MIINYIYIYIFFFFFSFLLFKLNSYYLYTSLLDDNDTESRAIVQNLIYEAKIQELTKKIEA